MRDLTLETRSIRGKVIANLAELQAFAYEVPEGEVPPSALTRLAAGMDLDPDELYRALETEGARAAGDSDSALVFIETLKARLRKAFPDELSQA